MIEIRQILCPVDFSETSRHALEHAVVIAKWYQSRVTALHVIQLPVFPPPPILTAFADTGTPVLPSREAREEELQAWLEPARQAGVHTERIVAEGNAAACILQQATSSHPDLIAMGTHGLGGFERFVLGSVAEKVLRKASCPVMTIPPSAVTTAKLPYKRLLCPVDFSESSLTALRFAASLAKEADANLTILHVFDWPPDGGLQLQRFDVPRFLQDIEQETRGRLDGLVTEELRTWCKPSTKAAHGKPYREILATAEREGTDLIVIGVRGRNQLDLSVFGSTTNQVVRRASCPVLTLKE